LFVAFWNFIFEREARWGSWLTPAVRKKSRDVISAPDIRTLSADGADAGGTPRQPVPDPFQNTQTE
jgi:hypothetical protein